MDIMNIEKEIEDLYLESTKQEVIIGILRQNNLSGASIKELANLRAQREIAFAKHKAISAQADEALGKLIKALKARNQGALHNKDSNGQNTVYEYTV